MTDDENVNGETGDPVISTYYLRGVDEAVEHLRAAETLGLGVRLQSYWVPGEDGDESYVGEWELEVLQDRPVRPNDERG